MCFQTQQIKDRMDAITAVSFLSDKSLCLQLLKGKKKACKSPTRNELNELSFHMCNSFLTNHLLVVVVTREFPRWMILFIIVMKLGWGEGKWIFLSPILLLCQTTAKRSLVFKVAEQINKITIAQGQTTHDLLLNMEQRVNHSLIHHSILVCFHCKLSSPFRGRLPGSPMTQGFFCCCQKHSFWQTVESCLVFQFRCSLHNSGTSN